MSGIDGNKNDILKLGKSGNQINLSAFDTKNIVKNDINKSVFEKFDFNKDGKLDEKEVKVLKAFLLNRAGNDGILSDKEVKNIKQFGTQESDVNNFYAALNDMYAQQVTPDKPKEQIPVQPSVPENNDVEVADESVEEPSSPPTNVDTPEQEEPEITEEKNYQYKVNYKDTWYGIVQAKYGITDHKQTMEIVRQLKAQNNVDPKSANMPSEITLPENITLKDGTDVKVVDIDAAVNQSHWGYKTQSKTGRYTITQNGETKYYAADGTELKQSYYEAKEASQDKYKKSENGSGRYSYTAKNGDTYYFASDGTLLKKDYYVRRENEYSVVNAQKARIENAKAAFKQQQDEDGWAGKAADAVSVLWNSDNRAVKVEEDLKTYENQIKQLQQAQAKGPAAFSAKFKEIYGVDYNPNNIAAYQSNPTDENYKKAYGTKNDIHKRVMDYNISQQAGAEIVKGTATVAAGIAIGVATGGVGLAALGAAAAGTAATSMVVNTSDRLSSNVGLKDGELADITKGAAIDGASALAGGVLGKVVGTTVKGVNAASVVARATANAAGDVAIGAGTEYMQTGQVTLEGTAINAAMAGVGFGAESGAFKKVAKKVRSVINPRTDIPTTSPNVETPHVNVTNNNIVDNGNVARNIEQRHINANSRKMVDEALQDIPTSQELDAYANEFGYKAPDVEQQAALDAHQANVRDDYDAAHRIENNAQVKEQNSTSTVKSDLDKLNEEIKGLDASIRRLEQQIAGAKRFGKDTTRLENQLKNLQTTRAAKMTEADNIRKPVEPQTEAVSEAEVPHTEADAPHTEANTPHTETDTPHIEVLSSEDKMAMGQIGNNINRAKSLDDLDKAQQWLDQMPECEQKSRLQSQIIQKLNELSSVPDDVILNSSQGIAAASKSGRVNTENVTSSVPQKRPYYKAGVDYKQNPSFTQYSNAELKQIFEREPLSIDRFKAIAEDNYDDLRLSGKYTREESITGNFDDIYNPSSDGVEISFQHGWLWHKLDNGCKMIGKDRISLAVKADPKMLAEIDELMLKGSYKDAAGNVHQLKGKEFTKGFYKTDINEESWMQRHDPLTFYFDDTVSEEMIDALATVTDKYKRIPQRELPGAVDGCPWIAHEAYITGADIDKLIQEAGKVNRNLAEAIKSEGRNISTGQYNSYKKLIADYKQYINS